MAIFNETQTSFTAGEINPKALSRIDIEQYRQACENLENVYLGTQGGAFKRPGTQHVVTQDGGGVLGANSFAFEYNVGTGSIIFFRASTIAVVRYDIVAGTFTSHTFQPVGIRVPFLGYTAAEFPEVRTKLVGDRLYFTHKEHPPWYIDTTTVSKMWYQNITFFGPGPTPRSTDLLGREWPFQAFLPLGGGDALIASATSGAITLTFVGVGGVFTTGMIGSPFRFEDGGVIGYAFITAVTDAFIASATVTQTLPAAFTGGGAKTFNIPSWDNDLNWPSKVEFFESRLILAGPEPDTIYGSQVGDVQEFTNDGTIDNSFPFAFSFNVSDVREIQWLSAGDNLVVGTTTREHIVQGPDPALSLGPLNVDAKPRTNKGSSFVDAVRFENSLLFAQKSGNDILEFIFDFNEQSFRSFDVSALSNHIFKKQGEPFTSPPLPKIVKIVVQNSKKQIWFLDNNGQLSLLKRNRELNIFAFNRIKIGGILDGGPPQVISLMVVNLEDQIHDDVYLIVKRTIDSPDQLKPCMGSQLSPLERVGQV